MKTERYSFSDVGVARWVLRTQATLDQGPRVIAWANKVTKWFKAYIKCVRKARKEWSLSWIDAVSLVWETMREHNASVYRQLRHHFRIVRGLARWQNASMLERNTSGEIVGALESCRPAKGKFPLHAKRRRQVDVQELTFNRPPLGYHV